jgi:Flp pilus assembly CpaE family ATPase
LKFAVFSPVHGQAGNTVTALFLAMSMALTQRKNICLTHTDFSSTVIEDILGLDVTEDVTRSLSQVFKLLNSGTLLEKELADYAINVIPGLDLYTTHKVALEHSELASFIEFLFNKMKIYHHIVIDVDSGRKDKTSELCFSIADTIVVTVTQNFQVLRAAKDLIQQDGFKQLTKNKRILFAVNRFNTEICKISEIEKQLGVKSRDLILIHDNVFISRCYNKGIMEDAIKRAYLKDLRVLNLHNDIKNACRKLLGKDFIWKEPSRGKTAAE